MSSSSAAPAAKTAQRKAKAAAPAAPAPAAAAPRAAAPVVAAPVVAAPVVAAPVAAAAPAATAAEENVNVVTQYNGIVEKVNSLRSTLGALFSEMKKLEKQIPRELKKAQKGRRRKTVDGEDKPKKETVFTKPTPISKDLCKFLGVAEGTLLSRSDVTKKVCAYAKTKGLMEKQNIKADAALRKLLALTEADELKILNLQRFLKPHYAKPATATA